MCTFEMGFLLRQILKLIMITILKENLLFLHQKVTFCKFYFTLEKLFWIGLLDFLLHGFVNVTHPQLHHIQLYNRRINHCHFLFSFGTSFLLFTFLFGRFFNYRCCFYDRTICLWWLKLRLAHWTVVTDWFNLKHLFKTRDAKEVVRIFSTKWKTKRLNHALIASSAV